MCAHVCMYVPHKILPLGGAGSIMVHGQCPYHISQEEPFTQPSLSQMEARIWLSISQITVLKKSLRSETLVNKSLLLLWFTTFLRTLRANFSTLLRLWGTADTVEPVPFRGWPASPQSVWSCKRHFMWQWWSGQKYEVWQCVKAGKGCSERPKKGPKHVWGAVLCELRLWHWGGEGKAAKCCWAGGQRDFVGREGQGGQAELRDEPGCGFPLWIPASVSRFVHSGVPLRQRGRCTVLHFTMGVVKLCSGRSRRQLPYHANRHCCVQWPLTSSACSRWRGKPCEYVLRLFSFTSQLLAKESSTWYLLVLESNTGISAWHWA